ncbi:glycosyltransferase [Chamaesiphon minutus]|uniref:Putative glycosyltransferase n=1 Tax=Chamaesiphon minutus (strain ATCC 27169 / PCC 6605) TaxID=1173020 RepID=K9UN97_CHAP6|nr:glycosyltransferase [Chamaesiphon minutus]AFY96582.1 putative glycosyltransferase [Chamaesiphon minutus PCC 6605]
MIVSIVIPVYNGGESFQKCLSSLKQFIPPEMEVVVVVDGGTDGSERLARSFGAKVATFETAGGPARARNRGAQVATGDVLLFLDADVTIHADTLPQVLKIFEDRSDVTALIGSYDDAPGAPNFLSQYKNLFHHYTHQNGAPEASTFWGACGAIRREVFLELGGFDENYRYPSVEDIDLGYRLKKAGYRIELCKTILVKHLKCWQPINLLRAEFFYRALPWTELIWRDRQFVNDLNLKISSRISIIFAYCLLLALVTAFVWIQAVAIAMVFGLALLSINWPVYQFFYQQRGWWFACGTVFWHWLYFLYGGLAFAIGTIRYHLFSRHAPFKPKLLEILESSSTNADKM